MTTETLTIIRPDDWHLHLRDGAMLQAILPFSAAVYGRAIVMPNLTPPVRTPEEGRTYLGRIRAVLPENHPFEPLMTAYLTDTSDPSDIEEGSTAGLFHAVKLYPAGATTNSEFGVTAIENVHTVLETMERIGIPLLVHGEVTDPAVDVFDREKVYLETVLEPMRERFPGLRIVLEHATTSQAIDYVKENAEGLAATITPHHMIINRNELFRGGLRPHMYCLPVAKREEHRLALRKAATSGDSRFFLGTDSAPHPRADKETDCGCAGIFNAPNALECVAQVFEEEGALETLEKFVSISGAEFYGKQRNSDSIVLEKFVGSGESLETVSIGEDVVRVFTPPTPLRWRVASGLR